MRTQFSIILVICLFQFSLKIQAFGISAADSLKVCQYTDQAFSYLKINRDSSKYFIDKAADISEKQEFLFGLGKINYLKGLLYRYEGKYFQAKDYTNMAIRFFQKTGSKKGEAECIGNLGVIAMEQSDFAQAVEDYFNSLKLFELLNDEKGIAYTLGNIGLAYSEQGKTDQALDYLTRSLKLNKKLNDEKGISKMFNLLGVVYKKKKLYKEALSNFNDALIMGENLKDKLGKSYCLENIAEMFSDQGDLEKAKEYYIKSLTEREAINHKPGIAKSYYNLGKLIKSQGNLALSKSYYEKAIELADEMKMFDILQKSYHDIAEICFHQNNMLGAYNFLEKAKHLNDSLYEVKSNTKISQMEMEYVFQKKRHKIEIEQKQKEAQQLLETNRQKIFRNVLIIGFLLIGLIAFILFKNYRKTSRINRELIFKNNEIEQQKEEILSQKQMLADTNELLEMKNQKITDSINYAKRIQDALLPSVHEIKKIVPDCFVWLAPRDIVSGDFYWMCNIEDYSFIVCADCTGHGIPGAFMSMIGNTLLNEIILNKKITEPSKVLLQLNNSLRCSINRGNSIIDSQDDGMDISICRIDRPNKTFTLSAANQNIVVFRNGESEIFDGGVHSVGGLLSDRNFNGYPEKTYSIESGITIYMMSDGYQDQFNPAHKKLGFKSTLSLIQSIQKSPLNEQSAQLIEHFGNWKHTAPQVDDVLLIGFSLDSFL